MIPQEDPYDTIRRLNVQIDDLTAELEYEKTYSLLLRTKADTKALKKKLKKLARKLPVITIGSF